MRDRNKKIKWEIGRAFQSQDEFFSILDELPEGISYGEIQVYEGISMCAWNAGRFVTKERMKYENMQKFYDRGINISLTMTNTNIDINDKLGNETLDRFYRKGNCMIVCDDILRKHIRTNYPDYHLIYSITSSYAEEVLWELKNGKLWDYYKKKLDEYDVIVVPKELLEPPLYKDLHKNLDVARIEFVVDNDCYLYCKIAGKVYRTLRMLNKVKPFGKTYDFLYKQTCLEKCLIGPENFNYWYSKKRLQDLIDKGLVRFKIARHEEYPVEHLMEQWRGYIVDYNKAETDLKRWDKFHEKGLTLENNSIRNIIDV